MNGKCPIHTKYNKREEVCVWDDGWVVMSTVGFRQGCPSTGYAKWRYTGDGKYCYKEQPPKNYQLAIVDVYKKIYIPFMESWPVDNKEDSTSRQDSLDINTYIGIDKIKKQFPWYERDFNLEDKSMKDYLEVYLPRIALHIAQIEGYRKSLYDASNQTQAPEVKTAIAKQNDAIANLKKLAVYPGAWDTKNLQKIDDSAYKAYTQGMNAYRASLNNQNEAPTSFSKKEQARRDAEITKRWMSSWRDGTNNPTFKYLESYFSAVRTVSPPGFICTWGFRGEFFCSKGRNTYSRGPQR